MNVQLLECSLCRESKATSEFSPRNDRARGFASRCRDCCRSARCVDCGAKIWRGSQRCGDCKSKGEQNPMHGRTHTEAARAAISRAQSGMPEPPRPWKKPKNAHSGRGQACRMYVKPLLCERCSQVKPLDWHHIDEDATNNDRANLMAVCRQCHQCIDGRNSPA